MSTQELIMKLCLTALACAMATLTPLTAVHAQTVALSQNSSAPTVLDLGVVGTADPSLNTSSPVALGGGDYYFSVSSPVGAVTSYLGDLNLGGSVSSSIYQVSGASLSLVAGTTLTDSIYGGAGVVSATYNLAPGEYALAITGQNGSPSGSAVANVKGVSAVSAAPEPATWALMVIGVGAIGVAMRRARRTASAAVAAA